MDPVLVGVTLISLVLAIAMAVVAVKLLRDTRERSAARVEALQALIAGAPAPAVAAIASRADDDALDAFEIEPPLEPGDFAPAIAASIEPAPVTAPIFAMSAPVTTTAPPATATEYDESWDLALRQHRSSTPVPAPEPPPAIAAAPATAAAIVRTARAPRPRRPREIHARYTPVEPASEPLFAPPEQRTPSHRWAALAAVAMVMAAGIGGVYAIATTDVIGAIGQAFSGRGTAATTNVGAAPLELLSLRHTTDSSGEFILTGLVQNPPTGVSLRGVVAVVYLFDRENKFFASGKAAIEVPILSSGSDAPFVIRVPGASGVTRYRVGFRHEDGAVVAHVDRRGELPGATTGGNIEGERVIDRAPTGTRVIG